MKRLAATLSIAVLAATATASVADAKRMVRSHAGSKPALRCQCDGGAQAGLAKKIKVRRAR